MARFEHSDRRGSRDRDSSPRRDNRGRDGPRDSPRSSSRDGPRDSGRSFSGNRDFDRNRSSGRSSGRSFGGNRDFDRDKPRGRFGDRSRGRDSDRDGGRREMTKVTCSSCGDECQVPFKPTSSKPVYCDSCFSKTGKSTSGSSSSAKDFEIINDKLNKIMKALNLD